MQSNEEVDREVAMWNMRMRCLELAHGEAESWPSPPLVLIKRAQYYETYVFGTASFPGNPT